jgi:heme A synthase
MTIVEVHRGLANAASLFLAILAAWAFVQFIRTRPLDGNWFGAAVIAEFLLLGQFILGFVMAAQGLTAGPRPWIHILYGSVAIISLPAAYTYFNRIDNPRVQTLAMAVGCLFLWGIVQRAGQVIYMQVPY